MNRRVNHENQRIRQIILAIFRHRSWRRGRLLARKETRNALRLRSAKSLDYVNQQATKLRDAADEVAKKDKQLIGPGPNSVNSEATPKGRPIKKRSVRSWADRKPMNELGSL
jgi:hypothetical protein